MLERTLDHYIVGQFDNIPLFEDVTTYRVESDIVDIYFDKLAKYGYTEYETLKECLYQLVFEKEDVENHILNGVPLHRLEEWRKQLFNYVINKSFTTDDDDRCNLQDFRDKFKNLKRDDKKRIVLNKKNPFAQVIIKNTDILYPSNSGYQILSFLTNQQLTLSESEGDGVVYTLLPGFKVAKAKNLVDESILLTDSVSTPLPDKKDNIKIIYV